MFSHVCATTCYFCDAICDNNSQNIEDTQTGAGDQHDRNRKLISHLNTSFRFEIRRVEKKHYI